MNKKVIKSDIDLVSLIDQFGSEESCRAYLESLRWPDGIACPRCQSKKISRIKKRGQFDCDSCRYQFSVLVGSVFSDTHLPLHKWMLATYIICESKKGVSSNQLKRMLGVSYKTAWHLTHRIRSAMKDEGAPLLSGIVEVDEAYVGGKRKGVGQGSKKHRTMVLGAIARGGDVRFKVEKRNDRKTLHGFINSVVADDAEAIFTDDWHPYKGIADENTRHEIVNHTEKEWVRGQVHTNTVEGVWSLLKRSLIGSYHQLSAKHLPAYLDELSWRFNNRQNPYLFRDTVRRLLDAETLRYQQLIEA
ncbi:MAG: IS1595 family transposase [Dehalococcoidia bacterium]